MKHLQQLMLFLMVGCLLIYTPIQSMAATLQIASGSNPDAPTPDIPVRVTSLTHPDYDLTHISPLEFLQNDTGVNNYILEDIISFINQIGKIEASVLLPDGTEETIKLSTSLNYASLFPLLNLDPCVEGSYEALASINFSPIRNKYGAYELDEDILEQISVPIKIVIPDEPVILTHLDVESTYMNQFKKVTAVLPTDDLDLIVKNDSENLLFRSSDSNARYSGRITWDSSTTDRNTPGIYRLPTVFQSPLHCELAPNATLPDAPYFALVQEPEKPELYDYTPIPNGILFPWIVSAEHAKEIKVWLSKDGGPWMELPNEGVTCWDQHGLCFTIGSFFTPNSSYQLQVDYRGGKTNILSFTYNDIIVITGSYEGDRDGGDTNGNPPSRNESVSETIPADPPDPETSETESDGSDGSESLQEDPPTVLPETNPQPETSYIEETLASEKSASTMESVSGTENTFTTESVSSTESTFTTESVSGMESTFTMESDSSEPSAFIDETIVAERIPVLAETDSPQVSSADDTVTPLLPIVTAVAAAAAIASLLFLNITKRRN